LCSFPIADVVLAKLLTTIMMRMMMILAAATALTTFSFHFARAAKEESEKEFSLRIM
jgi:hypothetical protein